MRVLSVRLILSLSFNMDAFYGRPVRSVKWRRASPKTGGSAAWRDGTGRGGG